MQLTALRRSRWRRCCRSRCVRRCERWAFRMYRRVRRPLRRLVRRCVRRQRRCRVRRSFVSSSPINFPRRALVPVLRWVARAVKVGRGVRAVKAVWVRVVRIVLRRQGLAMPPMPLPTGSPGRGRSSAGKEVPVDDEEAAAKKKGRPAARRGVGTGRRGDAGVTAIKEWREADLLERQGRIAGAAGVLRDRKREMIKQQRHANMVRTARCRSRRILRSRRR